MSELPNASSIKSDSNGIAALRHLTVPLLIKNGVYLYPDRHVDQLAPVGALLAEPIEIRPIRLTAQCQLVVQVAENRTEHFAVFLTWDEERKAVSGVGVNKNGHAIDVELRDANVELSINAPHGIVIVNDRHLMSGLVEKSMEAKMEITARSLARDEVCSKAALSLLSIDELCRRYAILEELHFYAKRRIHHWRTAPETLAKPALSRSQLFKTTADQLNAQLGLIKAEMARHIQPNFVELYRFHQLAHQVLDSETFKSLNERAKSHAYIV